MAKKVKIYNQYENMEFPEYEYQEYPKHLVPEGGNPMKDFVEVGSEEEELAVLKSWAKDDVKAPAPTPAAKA